MGNHRVPVEKRLALSFGLIVTVQGRSSADLDVAEPAFLVFVLEHDIHHLLLVLLGPDTCELGIILCLVDDLDSIDNLRRKALDGQSGVFLEEGLSSHRQPVHLFSIHFNGTIGPDFDSGHLLQEIGQHRVLDGTICIGVEDKRVLLDNHRIAGGGHGSGIEKLAALLQLDLSEALLPFEVSEFDVDLFLEGDIAQEFHVQVVFPLGDFIYDGESVAIRQGEIRNDSIALVAEIDRGVIDRIACLCVHNVHPDLRSPVSVHHPEILPLGGKAGQAEEDDQHHAC